MLAAALAALCRTAAAASCTSGPTWCFSGYSVGTNYTTMYAVSPTYDADYSKFTPETTGACSCVSYSTAGQPSTKVYTMADSEMLATYQSSESISNVYACSTSLCNCNATGCMNPLASGGACATTPSTGALQCRVGQVGTEVHVRGENQDQVSVSTTTIATPGNLAAMSFPAGSLCFSYNYVYETGSNYTIYDGGNTDDCVSNFTGYAYAGNTGFASCATNNCGAPTPTGPQCPNTVSATTCYAGLLGPAVAVDFFGTRYGMTAPYTPSVQASGPACMTGTIPCDGLVAISGGLINNTVCPTGSSITVYTNASAVSSNGASCNNVLMSLTQMNATNILACGTNACNSPTAPVYVAATATLDGYTVSTFGTAETAQFSRAMAAALNVAASAVTVTGVSAAGGAAGRRLLSGVVVAFTVTSTVGGSSALTTALAAPIPAATFQSAGLTQVTTVSAAPAAAASATAPTPIVAATLPQTGSGAAPSSAVTSRCSAAAALAVAVIAVALAA